MSIVHWVIDASVRNRVFVIIGTLLFVVAGVFFYRSMTFDAFPDLTNVQVQVVTASPGLSSAEVEQLVTLPIERGLGSLPNLRELRSLSRPAISSITVVFEDGTDRWLARQLVKERLDLARGDIPDSAGVPELAPPTTGLGEVYQFTVASTVLTPHALYRVFQRDLAPRLRTIDGVVEVNAWGGGLPQLQVHVDPFKLANRRLNVETVHEQLSAALGLVAGGAIVEGSEQTNVRGVATAVEPAELEAITLATTDAGDVRLGDVAHVTEGGGLTVGLGSGDGEGEKLFVMVQLLADADARQVVADVAERLAEIRESLPDGVEVSTIYNREKLVGNTLTTVATSLIEGGALVIVVLLLLLGDLRSGFIVASVIPISMLGAFMGLNLLGYSGNLMSLGAIDFGLIVDGTIVVVESIVALPIAATGAFGPRVAERARRVARPVLSAVGILILVYTPVMLMPGTEGKLFRPMALTVLLALSTALVLSFTYVPAVASWLIKPRGDHDTAILRVLRGGYRRVLDLGLRWPWRVSGVSVAVLGASVLFASSMGVEFVPRLEEGDLVIQTERLPGLSPQEALREVTRVERIVGEFPAVARVASRTGSPAVATDPMGLGESDILVALKPHDQWPEGQTLEDLVEAISARLKHEAPGAVLGFTQPIEMRFNELLEGITSDLGVEIYGPDLDVLKRLGQEVAATLEGVAGAADVAAPTAEGVPQLDVVLDATRLATYGLTADAALAVIQDVQRGTEVGTVTRGQYRDPVMVKLALPAGVPLADVPLVLAGGKSVPLASVADLVRGEGPATITRMAGSRRVVVEANVRGRDIGGFSVDARRAVDEIALPDGYWIAWSGKYEQLQAASARMSLLIPIVLLVIIGLLYVALGNFRATMVVFVNVPIAISGGLILLWLRDLPISMSAVVGFIALFGIAVMNGIVLVSRVQELANTLPTMEAARRGALERFRPVLMTAAVAGIGFVPMALATGVGAEVQRPLATVVIGGLVTSTVLTLFVLPSIYARFVRVKRSVPATT